MDRFSRLVCFEYDIVSVFIVEYSGAASLKKYSLCSSFSGLEPVFGSIIWSDSCLMSCLVFNDPQEYIDGFLRCVGYLYPLTSSFVGSFRIGKDFRYLHTSRYSIDLVRSWLEASKCLTSLLQIVVSSGSCLLYTSPSPRDLP